MSNADINERAERRNALDFGSANVIELQHKCIGDAAVNARVRAEILGDKCAIAGAMCDDIGTKARATAGYRRIVLLGLR